MIDTSKIRLLETDGTPTALARYLDTLPTLDESHVIEHLCTGHLNWVFSGGVLHANDKMFGCVSKVEWNSFLTLCGIAAVRNMPIVFKTDGTFEHTDPRGLLLTPRQELILFAIDEQRMTFEEFCAQYPKGHKRRLNDVGSVRAAYTKAKALLRTTGPKQVAAPKPSPFRGVGISKI